jgi:hypothetical protein
MARTTRTMPPVPFTFDEIDLHTRNGSRRALVMAPDRDYRVGLERLEELRRTGRRSAIDTGLVEEVRQRDGVRVVIFRGVNDAGERWGLDPALSDEDASELAKRLTMSHIKTWRQLIVHGAWVMIHTEFSMWGPTFRDTCRELADDLQADPDESSALHEFDRWLLRNLVFFFGQSLESVASQVLPKTLHVIERRSGTIDDFVQTMSAERR